MAKPVKPEKSEVVNKTTGEINTEAILKIVEVNRVKTEAEARIVMDIFDRFTKMKDFREQSCPWRTMRQSTLTTDNERTLGNETQNETVKIDARDSWERRWLRDDELSMMKPTPNFLNAGLPPVNAPVVWGAKQAITTQYQDQNISITIQPEIGVDDIVAKIAEAKIKDVENRSGIERMKKESWFPSYVTRGTIITYNSYVCKKRTVQKVLSLEDVLKKAGFDDDMVEEEQIGTDGMPLDPELLKQLYESKKQEFTKKIKKDPKKYLLEEVEIVDYDDPYSEMVNLEELYIDPYASDFNGLTRGARDVCWVQYLPVNQVLREYENSNDPFLIKENITPELILSGNQVSTFYTGRDNPVINNIIGHLAYQDQGDLCCVVRYFNQEQDKYIVLINDIVVRDGVLPYNHKQLPFSKACMVELPNCFYGAGLGVLLDQTQQDTEFFQALRAFLVERNSNQPIGVTGEDTFNRMKDLTADGNTPLKGGTLIQIDTGESVQSLQLAPINYDIEKLLQTLHENQTIIAGVNPQQNALPNPNLAVRSAQMSQESSLLTIRSFIQNFEQISVNRTKQWLSIIKQIEPTNSEKIEDIMGEDLENPEVKKQLETYRKVKIPKDGGLGVEDPQSGKPVEYEDVEMNPDTTKFFDQLSVTVRVEVSQLASRQLQAQQLQDVMNTAMLIRGNPLFKDDKLINAIFKAYLDKSNMPTKVLALISEEQQSESTELGELQNLVMEAGQTVPPIFGMSEKHKKQHTDKLVELHSKKKDVELQMASMQPQIDQAQQMGDQMAIQQLQEQGMPLMQEMQKITKTMDLITEHLKGDMQRVEDQDIAAIKMTAPQPPTQQPMPEGQPQMQGGQPPQPPQEMPMNPMPQA